MYLVYTSTELRLTFSPLLLIHSLVSTLQTTHLQKSRSAKQSFYAPGWERISTSSTKRMTDRWMGEMQAYTSAHSDTVFIAIAIPGFFKRSSWFRFNHTRLVRRERSKWTLTEQRNLLRLLVIIKVSSTQSLFAGFPHLTHRCLFFGLRPLSPVTV